ncbi:3-hydroxyisobutyryl-CoA hydrolase [Sorochytrium milnesiophthora]
MLANRSLARLARLQSLFRTPSPMACFHFVVASQQSTRSLTSIPPQPLSTSVSTQSTLEVLHRKEQGARIFILNRPKKFNALTLDMIRNMTPQLQAWEQSDLCNVIILKSQHEKAFCAGGDVADLVTKIQAKKFDEAVRFFYEEYQLNHYIATTPKPFVAIMDGITMGGGVGLSVHAPFRVATEKTMFAMPETAIGLFPDVGGTFMLPRLDGQLGTYLGLTGDRLMGEDVFTAGIATHYVPSERIADLEQRLYEIDSPDWSVVNAAIDEFAEPATKFTMSKHRHTIDSCFAHDSIEEIVKALQQDGSEFAQKTVKLLSTMSPTSLKATLRQVREGAKLDIASAFRLEWVVGNNIAKLPDFTSGVSAKLISKPPSVPRWNPATPEQVTEEQVSRIFTPPGKLTPLSLLRSSTYSAYPHRLFALPKESDVREMVAAAPAPAALVSADAVAAWFAENWPTKPVVQQCMDDYTELHRAATRNRAEQSADAPAQTAAVHSFKRIGAGKVGVAQHVREIVQRCCTEQDGKVSWK